MDNNINYHHIHAKCHVITENAFFKNPFLSFVFFCFRVTD